MHKITRKYLRSFLEKHGTDQLVLEIGGGRRNSNHSYTEFFPNRYTIDIDPERLPDVVGDVHKLPFEGESYEQILCTEVLEHCQDPQEAISEMYRVLKPGGKLILSTRFVYPLHDIPNDYFRFTKYGLNHLLRNFTEVTIQAETETFSSVAALLQRICFQTKLRGNRMTKAFLVVLIFMLDRMNWLIRDEYGDIQKSKKDESIMTTGYYVTARK